jgi:hypothetical protein
MKLNSGPRDIWKTTTFLFEWSFTNERLFFMTVNSFEVMVRVRIMLKDGAGVRMDISRQAMNFVPGGVPNQVVINGADSNHQLSSVRRHVCSNKNN